MSQDGEDSPPGARPDPGWPTLSVVRTWRPEIDSIRLRNPHNVQISHKIEGDLPDSVPLHLLIEGPDGNIEKIGGILPFSIARLQGMLDCLLFHLL